MFVLLPVSMFVLLPVSMFVLLYVSMFVLLPVSMFVLLPVSMFVLLPVSMLWSKEPVTVRRMHTFPVAGSNVDMLIKEHGYVSYVSCRLSFYISSHVFLI